MGFSTTVFVIGMKLFSAIRYHSQGRCGRQTAKTTVWRRSLTSSHNSGGTPKCHWDRCLVYPIGKGFAFRRFFLIRFSLQAALEDVQRFSEKVAEAEYEHTTKIEGTRMVQDNLGPTKAPAVIRLEQATGENAIEKIMTNMTTSSMVHMRFSGES
jgi:hypothetical protein